MGRSLGRSAAQCRVQIRACTMSDSFQMSFEPTRDKATLRKQFEGYKLPTT